jgi:hypothetical protein
LRSRENHFNLVSIKIPVVSKDDFISRMLIPGSTGIDIEKLLTLRSEKHEVRIIKGKSL